jgi:hypothetical protein
MRFGISTMKIPDNLIRYGYYVLSMVSLEVYQLLTLRPVTILVLLLPLACLLGLLVVSKLVWAQCKRSEERLESI